MAARAPLTVYEPFGVPRGGIVVVQEAFGVNDHIDDVTGRLAKEGWLAVAPHLFHRSGDPKFGYDDFSQVMPHMNELTADGILTDIDTAIDRLSESGIVANRIGIVGFCMGGTVALATAARRDIGAAVTFYGGGVTTGRFGFDALVKEAPRLKVPWLGLYGDLDQSIPVADVEQLRVAAASSGQPTEVVRYPNAGHGFHCDQRADYEPDSAADAWNRALGWFNKHLST